MSENTEKTDEKQTEKPWLFKKGESGNPNGRPKGSVSVVSAIKRKLEEVPEGKTKTYLEYFVEQIMKKGVIEGDTAIMKDIIDRVDGKAQYNVDITSNGQTITPIYAGESVKTIPEYHSDDKDIPTP